MFNVRISLLALAALSALSTQTGPAAVLQEDFTEDPVLHGWKVVGETSLFAWSPANQELEVTWDSSKSNTFCCFPLGTVLAASDDFSFAFDLKLNDVAVGVNPAKPYSFELAVGLINLAEASRTNFFRGAGSGTPDLLEFDYFPDDGSGFSSLDGTMSDTNGTMQFYYADVPLNTGEVYRVEIAYATAAKTISANVSRGGVPYCSLTNSFLSGSFADFRLDHFALCSYSDAGQDPQFSGSLLAHGTIDNVLIQLPSPPVVFIDGPFSNGKWQVSCLSQTNWLYTLERTTDFQSWSVAAPAVSGTGATLLLQDSAPVIERAFYRVAAHRP
jgi:hypothetical protein